MIKIAICRKAQVRGEWVNESLEEVIGSESAFESFWSAEELKEYLLENGCEFTAYFFDNKVPGIDFVDLAIQIRKMDPVAFFLFIDFTIPKTAVVHRLAPYYSFRRPFDLTYMSILYEWVSCFQDVTKNVFIFTYRWVTHRLLKEDILYFEKEKRYAYVHTKDGKEYPVIMDKKEIAERVNPNFFAEVNISYIVNLMYVKLVEKSMVILQDGTKISLSRGKRKNVLKKITVVDQLLHKSDQLLHISVDD